MTFMGFSRREKAPLTVRDKLTAIATQLSICGSVFSNLEAYEMV
jgi:hypothetical protein